ncbi:hypothetical protein H6504_02470 [Candidatus Woesearchaeota archaeon]|nr:hypothetical protein [Candidatus Woesearchaeota archaeon]
MKAFWIGWFGALMVVAYLLSGSITGLVVGCEDCVCTSDADCAYGAVCCSMDDGHACEPVELCLEKVKTTEKPEEYRSQTAVYGFALLLVLYLGLYTARKFD